MKSLLILLCFLAIVVPSLAQNTFPSSGNVGIGTTSPDLKLHIKGSNNMFKIENIDISSNQFSQMNLRAGTADNYIWTNNQNSSGFYGGSSSLNIYTGQNSPIAFFTDGSNERMRIDGAGNIGIGTTNPDTKFHIKGSNNMLKIENINTSSNQYAQMNLKAGTADNYIWSNNQNSPSFYGGSSALNIYTGQNSPIAFFTNGGNERMRIDGAGNIGIGTTDTQGYKLAVNGNVIAESIKVKLHGSWPDYVFKNNYSLQTLSEIEKYIQINNHLPEIPSAEQIKKEGLDLGEMNAKLLKKIEELTLYIIDQNKRIEKLEAGIK